MERFTLRVASKRQITVPPRLLQLLNIREGDMVEILADHDMFRVRGLKLVPSTFFTQEMLTELIDREKELDKLRGVEVKDLKELATKFRDSKK